MIMAGGRPISGAVQTCPVQRMGGWAPQRTEMGIMVLEIKVIKNTVFGRVMDGQESMDRGLIDQ